MKVLMFGWEYPPHVFGGLATANYGISEGLKAQGDVDVALRVQSFRNSIIGGCQSTKHMRRILPAKH